MTSQDYDRLLTRQTIAAANLWQAEKTGIGYRQAKRCHEELTNQLLAEWSRMNRADMAEYLEETA